MRVFFILMLLLTLPSCATKKDIAKLQLPKGIKEATEAVYAVVNDQKILHYQKHMRFTKNGRIKYSKTVDPSGNLLQETEKKLWFIVERYPDKESFYCKTRWKPQQRERISCYTQKQFKQNEAIYHYNTDGTIEKIVDHFSPFHTQYFYYTNKELSKIIIKDNNDTVIDEILLTCTSKDEKGSCLQKTRISSKTKSKEEVSLTASYY